MKKVTYIILFAFLVTLLPVSLVAANGAAVPVHISGWDTLIVGFFECWLHSDGVTWQDTDHDGDRDKPGDGQLQKGELVVSIPDDLKASYENVTYKVIPFAKSETPEKDMTPAQMQALFSRGGGSYSGQVHPDYPEIVCSNYLDFNENVLEFRPNNYQLKEDTDNTTIFLFPDDINNTLDVKKQWQGDLVQGKRKLLPALVEFYGFPKQAAPPVPKAPQDLPCGKGPSITNTWETVYSWEEYHPSSYTDPVTGETIDDSWTETVYEIVPYSETLAATITVNTSQGIPESTRDSRGSWEIIP